MSHTRGWSVATIVAAVCLLTIAAVWTATGPRPAAAWQQTPICAIELTIDSGPTIEAAPGETISVPFNARITTAQVLRASVSISIGLPAGIEAGYAPQGQTFSPPEPGTISTFNIPGSITATVPPLASNGESWAFASNSASLFCEFVGTGAPFNAHSEAIGFRIVAAGEPPTATPTATSEPSPTPTNTPEPTATVTATATATASPTAPPTATASTTPTPTATATASPTPTTPPTSTPTATVRPTATATATATGTVGPRRTPTARPTGSPTVTPTASATVTAPATATTTVTATATEPAPATPGSSPTPPPAEPTSTPTNPPESDDDGGALVLDFTGRRVTAHEEGSGAARLLRAGMGVLGGALLLGGLYGIWRGGNRP